jgi:predicted DNA-binding helix-hairpin-helix protein
MDDGMLDLSLDPKLAWALKHRAPFPVDVNSAPREMLLRVPGLGVRSVDRIIASRRSGKLRLDDLARLTKSAARARDFLVTEDWRPKRLDDARLKTRLVEPRQMELL